MVGQHIGKYRVTEQVGRGGMGTVYRAMDETLHREVAVKVLNADLGDPTVARRFRAEAVTIARLNHPGIATIYELLQHDGQWLMVMEFLRGETLETVASRSGPMPVERAADLVMQALSALTHAHSLGVVHRDLKPANVMLADNGVVKIMDFGIARVAGGEQLTSAGFMMGTPAYMAPEQVLGQEIDARTDLYAIGVVLFKLVTGQLPFGGKTPLEQAQARLQDTARPVSQARAGLPAWVGVVLDIALAREPERRFQTALTFREAIRRGLANLAIETPAPAASVPPELVATAAPSSMPVLGKPPAPTPTPAPTVTKVDLPPSPPAPAKPEAPPPPPPPAQPSVPRPAAAIPHQPRSRQRLPIAHVAAAVAVLAVVTYWFLGRRPAVPVPPETEAAVPATNTPTPPEVPPAAAGTSNAPVTPVPAPPAGSARASAPPASTPQVPTSTSAPAASTPAGPGATVAGPVASGAATAAGATGATRGDTRGRAAVAEQTVAFRNVRAFLVNGRNVNEQDAMLSFGNGQVALLDEKGQRRIGAMLYTEITSVAHSRGKNPRWYPTLAAPPANVDMPGGVFGMRGDRHWLAFQSRSNYLLVGITDGDYKRIVETTNARLAVKVQTLAAR